MGKLFEYFVGAIFISIASYYMAVKISNEKFQFFSLKKIKYLLFQTIILTILYFINPSSVFRLIINIFLLAYIYNKIFKYKFFRCFILSFMFFTFILISEIFFVILNVFFFNNGENFIENNYFTPLISNFIISIIIILFCNFKSINNLYKNLFENFKNQYHLDISIIIFYSCLCLAILLYYVFFDITPLVNLLVALFLIICYLSFPILLLGEKNLNTNLRTQYEVILKDIENYEKDLTKQRMKNHENKNNLLSIKGMTKDTNVKKFINQLINDNSVDDQDILNITKNIPMGGLQGLIYQKLLNIKDKNINYFININNKIKKDVFDHLSDQTTKDICIVVGVFIDNAIQEVERENDSMFAIQMYYEQKNIVIEISNNYEGNLLVNCFDKKGFSTKNKGRGYGLSLVKEIIDNNKDLNNTKEINGNIFIQKLIIKL